MKQWKDGEIRRCEHAWSPRHQCDGYYMLGAFVKNMPTMLEKLLEENEDAEVLLIKYTGMREPKRGDHPYMTFRIVGKYTYENLPPEFRDNRGQYPSDCDQGDSWDRDKFNVYGFPLRPGIPYPVPCTEEEFYDIYRQQKARPSDHRD